MHAPTGGRIGRRAPNPGRRAPIATESLRTVPWALAFFTALALWGLAGERAWGRTLLKNICRVKGQEESTLRGLGLVVGLSGTGDSGENVPTMRALARAMELMNSPVGVPGQPGTALEELQETKNVALVWVTATVPPTGGRAGNKLNCSVSAISAESLAGGRLAFAALHSQNLRDGSIYGFCEGRIHLDDDQHPTEGQVYDGCRLVEDIFTPFHKDGKFTLVLNKNHADFQIASGVVQSINTQVGFSAGENQILARAIDPANIEVRIPPAYQTAPVEFVAEVMDLPIFDLQTEARVVINERAGSIVISGDVEIGAVVVTHKNITVDTENRSDVEPFVGVDPEQPNGTKLKSLVDALNAVKVPTEDVIEIIKGLERNGKLHGKLLIQ